MATKIIRPILDQHKDNWVNSDSTTENLYSYIDEIEASDTDYVENYSTWFNYMDNIDFKFESSGIPIGSTINYVRIYCRGKREVVKHGYTTYPSLFIDSTYYDSGAKIGHVAAGTPGKIFTESFENYYFEFTTNPATSSDWTISEVDELIAGLEFVGDDASESVYVSQMYIEIDYTEQDYTEHIKEYEVEYNLSFG